MNILKRSYLNSWFIRVSASLIWMVSLKQARDDTHRCDQYLMEGRDGSWGEAVQAIASLDCGDGALEVRAIHELHDLEQAMTQHKDLQEERAVCKNCQTLGLRLQCTNYNFQVY